MSGSHTFLIVTHSYVSQSTHSFLWMLPLCCSNMGTHVRKNTPYWFQGSFMSSNIQSSPAYGVFISQLIRYVRASSSYECFILRAVRISNKLLGQGYVKELLKSSIRKFPGRYRDLIKQYEVPLSRMFHDILDNDHLQWHPPLIRHYTNFWPYYWSGSYYRIWPFTQLREVSIEHLQRARNANRERLLLRTLVLSHFGTCECSNVETNLSWICLVSGLLSSNIPQYFCFCLHSWLKVEK